MVYIQTGIMYCVGRAGRVAQGRVYRLVKYKFWHEHLPETCEPEMRVCYLMSLHSSLTIYCQIALYVSALPMLIFVTIAYVKSQI